MHESVCPPHFHDLPATRLRRMAAAGAELLRCRRELEATDDNVVAAILTGQGTFYAWEHYPEGDVFDDLSGGQYYYHAHAGAEGEHGHFHLFLRRHGMPDGARPMPWPSTAAWPSAADEIAHLGAISMDIRGRPTHLFCTNRWVTDETWFGADDVVAMLDRFAIDHARPSAPANRWITAMVALFQPQLAALLHARDRAIDARRADHAGDVLEDRELEITSIVAIDVDHQIKQVQEALTRLTARTEEPR